MKLGSTVLYGLLLAATLAVAGGHVTHIPTVHMNTSECPAESHLHGIRADISNKVSDVLAQKLSCGGLGWNKVAFLDMRDPNHSCPVQWRLYEEGGLRLCGMKTYSGAACDSLHFSTDGRVYSEVCGRIIGYQYGSPNGADYEVYSQKFSNSINEPYLDGVSVTYGRPRKHIWSFFEMFYTWKCCGKRHLNNTQSLGFIGSFCDTGNIDNSEWEGTLFVNSTLWDGVAGCPASVTCCHAHSGPWFQTSLPAPTASDIEVRICSDQHTANEDTPLELVEIYVR